MRKQRKQFLRGTGDTGYICKVQVKILKCYNSNEDLYFCVVLFCYVMYFHSCTHALVLRAEIRTQILIFSQFVGLSPLEPQIPCKKQLSTTRCSERFRSLSYDKLLINPTMLKPSTWKQEDIIEGFLIIA